MADRGRTALLCACVCVCLTLSHAYFVRYLNVTAPSLLDNRRLMSRYVRCIVGEGPCPPQARDIKRLLPELLRSDCAGCDMKLRQVYERCTAILQDSYPAKFSKMYKLPLKSTQNPLNAL